MSTILDTSMMMNTCWGDEAFGDVPKPKNNNTDIEPLKRALNIGVQADTRSTKEALSAINNNKLYWGKPLETIAEETSVSGEELIKCMADCSEKMKAVALEREAIMKGCVPLTLIERLQVMTREWTKLRSYYAEQYLESDLAAAKDLAIREMQAEIDAAKMAHDWESYHLMRPEIENLRDERARYEKWARDNKKMN
jgi:hypothetical protein